MSKLVFISLIFFLFGGCDQKETGLNPPYNMSQVWEIHHRTEWDSLSTSKHLIGNWKWNYSFCCGEGSYTENFTDNLNFFIQFNGDATLEIYENGIPYLVSSWHLRIEDGELYGLVADPPVFQLYGRILFTNDGVIFDDAYKDGGTNYFVRIE